MFLDQSGNVISSTVPDFLSPEWGNVNPFALTDADKTTYSRNGDTYQVYHDPGAPAYLDTTNLTTDSDLYKWAFSMVATWSAHLDPGDSIFHGVQAHLRLQAMLEGSYDGSGAMHSNLTEMPFWRRRILMDSNHLGAMTANAFDLRTTSTAIDFTDPATPVDSKGGPALKNESGLMLLWSGEANGDGTINAVDLNLFWRVNNSMVEQLP